MTNSKDNFKEFENKDLVLKSYPQKIFVEITRNCNLKCIMCEHRWKKNKDENNMDFNFFKQIADELFPHAEEIDLRGFGESTIHPEFEKFLDYTLKFNKRIILVTNLTLKNDELWKKIIKNDVWLSISIDGTKKETLEKIRRGSNFDIVMNNLKIIQKERDKNNINPWNSHLLITFQRDNIDELPEFINLAAKHGFKRIQLNPIRTHLIDSKNLRFHKTKVEQKVKETIKKAKEKGITVIFAGSSGTKAAKEIENKETIESSGIKIKERCKHPWTNLYITHDGKIGPCNHLMSAPYVLGDLKKGTFRTEWNNKKFQRFRKYNDTILRARVCHWCYQNRYDHF